MILTIPQVIQEQNKRRIYLSGFNTEILQAPENPFSLPLHLKSEIIQQKGGVGQIIPIPESGLKLQSKTIYHANSIEMAATLNYYIRINPDNTLIKSSIFTDVPHIKGISGYKKLTNEEKQIYISQYQELQKTENFQRIFDNWLLEEHDIVYHGADLFRIKPNPFVLILVPQQTVKIYPGQQFAHIMFEEIRGNVIL